MNELEPIELEFLMNTPELLADLQAASKGMKDFDAVVANAQKKFDEYKKTKQEAGKPNPNSGRIIGDIVNELAAVTGLDQGLQGKIATQAAEATAVKASTVAQTLYSAVVGKSTGALKLFRIALASTGIGLVVILMASLYANWDKVTASIKKSFPALATFGQKIDQLKSFVMGFLSAYLSLASSILSTLSELATFNFSTAIKNAKEAGRKAKAAYDSAYNEQDAKNIDARNKSKRVSAIEKENREIEVIEARTGKKQYDRRAKLIGQQSKEYKRDSKEWKELQHEKSLLFAQKAKEEEDARTKLTNKAITDANKRKQKEEAAYNKAAEAARQHYQKQIDFLSEVSQLETELSNARASASGELARIADKYDKLRKKAGEQKMSEEVIQRINVVEKEETKDARYKLETKELADQLNTHKQLYASFEAFKSKVGKEEAEKYYADLLGQYGTYADALKLEISKLDNIDNRSAVEEARLKMLQEQLKAYNVDQGKSDQDKYAEAFTAALTYEEKKNQIEQQFRDRKLELEKRLSGDILNEKINQLERQKAANLAYLSQEELEGSNAYRRLSDIALQLTRQQLKARLDALKDYLNKSEDLSPENRAKVQVQIDESEKLLENSKVRTYINQLEERKKRLIELQNGDLDLQSDAYGDIAVEVEEINKAIKAAKFQNIADKAKDVSEIFGDLSNMIGDSNEGLADTLGAVSEVAGAVADVAGGIVEGIMSGNPLKAIGGIVKGIGRIFSLQKAARESERKAQEEIKKRNDEIFQSGLDYNAMLRRRIQDEVKLNDIYQSRVSAIKEEMAAHSKNTSSILRDYNAVFARLLGLQTTVGQRTEKYGGFLGIGRKTRTVDVQKTVGSILGLGANAKITDEILDRLEELNAKQPLTGDAKTAFEQLRKLRDEYGSIADAQRELARELTDAVTGTTAQSIADSIRQGVASGKRTFADFAEDIESFLRDAILSGMETDLFRTKVQDLQDELATMMGDGVISAEERAQFQSMYLAIVDETKAQMDLLNQAGIKMGQTNGNQNSLQGAMRAASQESIDLLGGQMGGLKLAQLETRDVIKAGAAQQLAKSSRMIEIQIDIEKNTRRTANNTEKLKDIDESNKSIDKTMKSQYNDLKAAGILK